MPDEYWWDNVKVYQAAATWESCPNCGQNWVIIWPYGKEPNVVNRCQDCAYILTIDCVWTTAN